MSDVPEQTRCWEHLSIVLRGQTDVDMYPTAGCLFCELDGIPKRELDEVTQGAEYLEKPSSAFAFYMDRQKEERIRRVIITCDTKVCFTDGWNFDWLDMPANLEKEPLSIVMCGHVDSGKSTTTGCLLFELSSIPEREFDKLKQDEERLKKSSLVCIFFMARQKEEWERGVNTTCNTNEFFTDKWHYTIIDTPGRSW